jgi:hypothetical protein
MVPRVVADMRQRALPEALVLRRQVFFLGVARGLLRVEVAEEVMVAIGAAGGPSHHGNVVSVRDLPDDDLDL